MFKSLQARLVLSYVVVIVVCLTLVGLAALVLLRGYQRNLVYSRLSDRAVLAAGLTTQMLRRGSSPQEAVGRLDQQMNQGDTVPIQIHLALPSGRTIASNEGEPGNPVFGSLPARLPLPPSLPVRGEQRLASGARLLYVAEGVRGGAEVVEREASYILVLAQLYRPLRLAFGDLLPRLLWAGAIALFVSIGVAALMVYSIARPLGDITRAAEEVAAGNYDQHLEIRSPKEVSRLAASFNVMAQRVRSTLKSQQDLVANVSHELKTPLTSIQGFSQALLDGTAGDSASWQRAATVIHEEAGRMRRLVDDLLDLARLEAGQVELAQGPVDMAELLRASVARFAPKAGQAGITLLVDVACSLPTVRGDTDRLGQVFDNLVDNAVKHTRDADGGGRVVIGAEVQGGSLVCSVTDNDPGITADDLQRVFERFYQVDKSRVRRGSGAGLGLAIAQEIVEAHGGSIRAESVEGLGTRFTVELPLESP